MRSPRADTASGDDVRHLGTLIGGARTRIVAVSTSAIFGDRSLTRTYWGIDEQAVDSGFQGHLYARAGDVLVVRVPSGDAGAAGMVLTAIAANREIWAALTSLELSSPHDPVVVASDHPRPSALPDEVAWYVGGLLDAAVDRHRTHGEALLAFVFDRRLSRALGLSGVLADRARVTSLLMDKNVAMRLLQEHGIPSARTFVFDAGADLDVGLAGLPPSDRYVLKPAGGAAGIGVFDDGGRGATVDRLRDHIHELQTAGILPSSFQVQELLSGPPLGVTAHFPGDGRFELLDVHRQEIDAGRRFVGGRWSRALHEELHGAATLLCGQLAAIARPRLTGLVCLDVVDGKVIEINPRLTASAPIPHLLGRQDEIARHLGGDFVIETIDLRARVGIPHALAASGALSRLISETWEEHRVLVLPQGLNPFGDSRMVFVNDDSDASAQHRFLERLALLAADAPGRVEEM